MANITSFPALMSILGDGVSTTASITFAPPPTAVSLVNAFNSDGTNASGNISSVGVSGNNVVVTFNNPFTGLISVEVNITNGYFQTLPAISVLQATSPWITNSTISGGTVAVSNFPASQPVTGTFFQATQPISAAALPLPAGAATAALQAIPALTKGTQGATGYSTQDLKDAGRTALTFFIDNLVGSASEVLTTMGITKGAVAQTAATSYTVTAGKTLRLTSISFTARSTTNAQQISQVRVRTAASAIAITSPIVANFIGEAPAASTYSQSMSFEEGYQIAGGTQIAISHIEIVTPASTTLTVCLVGYEY